MKFVASSIPAHLLIVALSWLLLANNAAGQNCTERIEPEFAHVDGDLIVPAFVPVHDVGPTPLACGDLIVDAALEVEALLFAVDHLNSDETYLPGVQLGISIFDSCSSSINTNMLLSMILAGFQNIGSSNQAVKSIIGPGLSDTVIDSSDIINSFQLTQVSYSATSDELSNKTLFPYFLRTIPADDKLAQAMVDLLGLQGWSYVTTLHSDTDYGRDGIGAFQEFAAKKGICIGRSFSIPESAAEQDYLDAVADLLTVEGAAVVVLFLTREHTKQFLQTFNKESSVHLTFVAPETWDIYSDILDEVGPSLSGSFTILQEQLSMPELETYLVNLDPTEEDHPWFSEYWESVFNCSLSAESSVDGLPACKGSENITQLDSSVLAGHLTFAHYAVNAVFAVAEGLNNLLAKHCGEDYIGICAEYSENEGPMPEEVYEAILNSNPPSGAGGVDFSFNNDGEGPARYTIYNYQHTEGNLVVGNWIDNQLTINEDEVKLYDEDGQETSQLASICQKVSCLDVCQDSLALPLPPDKPPLEFQAPNTLWGIIVLAISGLGIFCCLCLFMFFLANYQNIVVKESSSSLSYLLLLGLLLLYVENLAFMFSPTFTTCTARRFGFSFFYSIIFAALFAKVVRLGRIGRSQGPKISFIRPWSQTALFCLLMLAEIALIVPWLVYFPSEAVAEYVEADDGSFEVIFVCQYTKKFFTIYQVYVYFLLFLTTARAISCLRYRDLEYEAVYIFLSCLATILCLVACILVYWFAGPEFEVPAFCVAITVNATVIMAAMFLPKVIALDPKEEVAANEDRDDQEEIVKQRNGDPNPNGGYNNPAGPTTMYTNVEDQITSF